jgi:tRNA(fMet)-specific endonuclease VapC
LLDTNAYCDAANGADWAKDAIKNADEILISPIVLGELLDGFRRGAREPRNRTLLRKSIADTRVSVVEVTEHTAEFYCTLVEDLRKIGLKILAGYTLLRWFCGAGSRMHRANYLRTLSEVWR